MARRRVLCLGLSTLILGGCHSLAGTWELAPGEGGTGMSVGVMTLAHDGTFTAQATYGSREEVMSGYYTYGNGELVFETDGSKRTYAATRDGDELTITSGDSTAKMVRMKRKGGGY